MALVQESKFKQAAGLYVGMLGIMDDEEMLAPRGEHYGNLARMYGAVRELEEVERWAGMAVAEMRLFGEEDGLEEVAEMEDMLRIAKARRNRD